MIRNRHTLALAAALATFATVSSAQADGPTRPGPFHLDVEVDPTAFVLHGHSLHIGLGFERFRLDAGAFAMDVPSFVHGHRDFDQSFSGYGLKLQYFPFEAQSKGFVGIDTGLAHVLVSADGSDKAIRRSQVSLGVQIGWRFDLPANFFVTPWIGLSYAFDARDVQIDGKRFEAQSWQWFPAIHLGYRFQ
jgi:hypothetical protein